MAQSNSRENGDRPVPPTNGIRPDVPEPRDGRRIDEPVPTIVGPRPEGGPGGKVSVPQGIERLLTLAAGNAEWRDKILLDPVGSAWDAKITLTDSEKAILKATTRDALKSAIVAMPKPPSGWTLGKVACAGVACAAAIGVAGTCLVAATATAGNRPHLPPPRPVAPTDQSQPPVTGVQPGLPTKPVAKEEAALEEALSASIALYRAGDVDGIRKAASRSDAHLMWVANEPPNAGQLQRMREFGDFLAKTEASWTRPSEGVALASFGPVHKAYHLRFVKRDGKWFLDDVNGGD